VETYWAGGNLSDAAKIFVLDHLRDDLRGEPPFCHLTSCVVFGHAHCLSFIFACTPLCLLAGNMGLFCIFKNKKIPKV